MLSYVPISLCSYNVNFFRKSLRAVSGVIGKDMFLNEFCLSGEVLSFFLLDLEFLVVIGMCSLKAYLCFEFSFNAVLLGDSNLFIGALNLDENVVVVFNLIVDDLGVIKEDVCLCLGVCNVIFSFRGLSGEFDIDIAEIFWPFCILLRLKILGLNSLI